jgi:hypothetical protein
MSTIAYRTRSRGRGAARWWAENAIDVPRTFPSTTFDDDADDLLAPAVDDWRIEAGSRRLAGCERSAARAACSS